MRCIKALIIYPLFIALWNLGAQRVEFDADAKNWCIWKNIRFTRLVVCKLFLSDKSMRNLFYYRVGPLRNLLSWLLPGYDHLQITTPRGQIGGGLIFQHGFSTIVSAERIGCNCKIYQQVTIGYNHKLQAPIIGDNVEICCGAKVIGGIRIGNNVLIGANAVVVKDVPDNSIIAGIPAKVIGQNIPDGDIFSRIKK